LNVANGFTYLSQDLKLQGGKVGNGGADFNGQGVVGCAVFIEGAGDLVEVAAYFPVFGGQLPDGGKQLVVDRGDGDDGANGRPFDGLPDKLGLADFIRRKTGGADGVYFTYTEEKPISA